MNKLKTLAILLFIITALNAKAQTYKVPIEGTNKAWIFESLDDNKRVALLVNDTLWVNRPFKEIEGSKVAVFELRYLRYKNKVYRYSYLYFDKGYFWTQNKKGKEIW